MAKRTVQHRAQAEERVRNKLLSELKRKNISLRRKVSRLQKMVQRLPVETEAEPEAMAQEPACGDCKSKNVVIFRTPTKQIRICKSCGHRE